MYQRPILQFVDFVPQKNGQVAAWRLGTEIGYLFIAELGMIHVMTAIILIWLLYYCFISCCFTMNSVTGFSVIELCNFLIDKGVLQDIIDKLQGKCNTGD